MSKTLRQAASPLSQGPNQRVLAALEKAQTRVGTGATYNGRVGFIIDATGSRESTWNEAQKIQTDMFSSVAGKGGLKLKLTHFGGSTLSVHEWMDDPNAVASKMKEVSCMLGLTQIIKALEAFLVDNPKEAASSIILVGDSFEENIEELGPFCEKLKNQGTKVFSFLEGDDLQAKQAFSMLSEKTGGAFAVFGKDMPLEDLCQGVALMAVGGTAALRHLKNKAAAQTLLSGPSANLG
ncbi:MAG: VWA domain-containing protein [Alphaproteobacteria bacterium]|nr:VWA domain-containing protein [Alphaproteobacteria bacterium]